MPSESETLAPELRAAMGEDIKNNIIPLVESAAQQYGVSFAEIVNQIKHQQEIKSAEEYETALHQAANPRG